MSSKKKNILVPLENFANKQELTFQLPDIFPSYPDQGTEFGKYAKRVIGKNKYLLLRQIGATQTGKATYAASFGAQNFLFTATAGWNYYFKKAIISYSLNADTLVEFRYYNTLIVWETITIPTGSGFLYLDYAEPIHLKQGNNLGFTISVGLPVTGFIELNTSHGWREEQ